MAQLQSMLPFIMLEHLIAKGIFKHYSKNNILILAFFRRDFRLVIGDPNDPSKAIPHPVIWLSDTKIINTVVTKEQIVYTVAFQKPLNGWQGFFFQLSFEGLDDTVLQLSSEVNIIPETYPFTDCYADTCQGTLV